MPVVDIRSAMESTGYLEVLPRALFPHAVIAGSLNATALAEFSRALLPTLPFSNVAPQSLRLGDAVRQAILTDPGTVAPLLQFSFADGLGYRVQPVLVDCLGNEVPDAYFTPVQPMADRCSGSRFPIASDTVGSNGVSTFDAFKLYPITQDPAAAGSPTVTANWFQITIDRRLYLHNVPTGCYRFRFVYGNNGGGSLDNRALRAPTATAQAMSIGASRPFRVLSPVIAISSVRRPTLVTALDTPLSIQPVVSLLVRPNAANASAPLRDPCAQEGTTNPFFQSSAAGLFNRCPFDTAGGLAVTVSAVSVSSGAEVPLYVADSKYDCVRTVLTPATGNTTAQYTATFQSLRFPSSPSQPPDSSTAAASTTYSISPGQYRLKFRSYGTVLLSDYVITVVGKPDAVVWRNATSLSTPAFITIGQPAPWPVSVRAHIDVAFQEGRTAAPSPIMDASSLPMPSTVVVTELIGGPVNSNARLASAGLTAITDTTGVATFAGLALMQGRSGVYAMRLRSTGVACNASSHILYVNFTNPIAVMDATRSNGVSWAMVTAPDNPLTVTSGTTLQLSGRVCPRNAAGVAAFPGEVIMVRTLYAYDASTLPAASSVVLPTVPGSNVTVDPCAVSAAASMVDPRRFADFGLSVRTLTTDASGCADIPPAGFPAPSTSVSIQVLFSARGVDSAPIHIRLLTPRDSQPFDFNDLRDRIPQPMGMVLAPLALNMLHQAVPLQALWVAGSVVSIAVLWALGSGVFASSRAAMAPFFAAQDMLYLTALEAAFGVALAFCTMMVVWFVSDVLLGAGAALCRRAAKWRGGNHRGSGVGVGGSAGGGAGRATSSVCAGGLAAPQAAATSTNLPSLEAAGHGIPSAPPGLWSSFDSRRRYELWHAAMGRMPRLNHPLRLEGLLHPVLVEAYAQIYTRYTLAPPGPTLMHRGSLVVPTSTARAATRSAGTGTWPPTKRGTSRPVNPADNVAHMVHRRAHRRSLCPCWRASESRDRDPPDTAAAQLGAMMSPEGLARLRATLYAVHLGLDVQAANAAPITPVTWAAFQQVAAHRYRSFGVVALMRDVARLTRSKIPAWAGEDWVVGGGDGRRDVDEEGGWTATGMGHLRAAFDSFTSRKGDAHLDRLLLDLEPSLHAWKVDILAVAASPPSLVRFITLCHERVTAACADALCDDCGIWAELRAAGFDGLLRFQPLVREGAGLHPLVTAILASVFRAHSTSGRVALTYTELSTLRANMGMPPVRRDIFVACAATTAVDSAASPLAGATVVNPINAALSRSTADGSGGHGAAGVGTSLAEVGAGSGGRVHDLSTLEGNTTLTVSPQEYLAIATRLYTGHAGVEEHLRVVLRAWGYSERLWYTGRPLTAAAARQVAVRPLVDAFDDVMESSVSTAPKWVRRLGSRASRLVTTAIFIPQRVWLAMGASAVLILFVAMLLHALSLQLVLSLQAAGDVARNAPQLLIAEVQRQSTASILATSSQFTAAANWVAGTTATTSGSLGAAQTTANLITADQDTVLAAVTGAVATSAGAAAGSAGLPPTDTATAVSIAMQAALASVAGQSAVSALGNDVAPSLQAQLQLSQSALTAANLGASTSAAGVPIPDAVTAQMQNVIVGYLVSLGVDVVTTTVDALVPAVNPITITSLVLAAVAVVAVWAHMLYTLHLALQDARRGVYTLDWSNSGVSGASSYAGVQAAAATISFTILAGVIFIIGALFSIPAVAEVITTTGRTLLLSLLGVSVAIKVLEMQLMSRVLTWGDTVVFRRLYQVSHRHPFRTPPPLPFPPPSHLTSHRITAPMRSLRICGSRWSTCSWVSSRRSCAPASRCRSSSCPWRDATSPCCRPPCTTWTLAAAPTTEWSCWRRSTSTPSSLRSQRCSFRGGTDAWHAAWRQVRVATWARSACCPCAPCPQSSLLWAAAQAAVPPHTTRRLRAGHVSGR